MYLCRLHPVISTSEQCKTQCNFFFLPVFAVVFSVTHSHYLKCNSTILTHYLAIYPEKETSRWYTVVAPCIWTSGSLHRWGWFRGSFPLFCGDRSQQLHYSNSTLATHKPQATDSSSKATSCFQTFAFESHCVFYIAVPPLQSQTAPIRHWEWGQSGQHCRSLSILQAQH